MNAPILLFLFVPLLARTTSGLQVFRADSGRKRQRPAPSFRSTALSAETAETPNEAVAPSNVPPPQKSHLIFPGGGIFFYWQAGCVTYLREQRYDLSTATATGASAGALAATMTHAGVDFGDATELALGMAAKAGVWDRSTGLYGIWGPMIRDWLDELLPPDAHERVIDKLSLLLTPVPTFGKEKIDSFVDRDDLIDCNMASVHLPWFLDGKPVTTFRNRPCIDGSFLANQRHYDLRPVPSQTQPPHQQTQQNRSPHSQPVIIKFDYEEDPAYRDRGLLEFVDAVSPDGIWKMIRDGKRFAQYLEDQGRFEAIPKL